MEKYKVPQISKNDVSCDYINEFNSLFFMINGVKRLGEEKYRKVRGLLEGDYLLKDVPVPKFYEERFDPEIYEDVINEKNKRRVKRINNLVGKVRLDLEKKSTDLDEFKKNMRAVVYFVRGDKI